MESKRAAMRMRRAAARRFSPVPGRRFAAVVLCEGVRNRRCSMGAETVKAQVNHINPETLHFNPAFSQVVTVSGPVRTVYVGAQTAVDREGEIVGKGDIAAQTEQALRNIQTCLDAAGAETSDVIQLTMFVAQGSDLQSAFAAVLRWWGNRPNPPLNNVVHVAGLHPPAFMISIGAVAVVPE
jgi:enamine deaminase RidA (YjgF/YER057c/UK114 family)